MYPGNRIFLRTKAVFRRNHPGFTAFSRMRTIRVLLSAAVSDHAAEGCVEVVCCCKLVEGQVHAVAPVVARVGRHVDALVVRIAAAKGSVHGEPVLERMHGQHCRRPEVLVENLTADPRLAEVWSISLPAEHLVVELLGHLSVLFPPCTDRVHVVG